MKNKILIGVIFINIIVVVAIAQQGRGSDLNGDEQDPNEQTWRPADINGDGTVNLLDLAILANHYLEPSREWLINRVAELEGEVELYKKRYEIMVKKIESFEWFLWVGEQQWQMEPNELRMLYDPNDVIRR